MSDNDDPRTASPVEPKETADATTSPIASKQPLDSGRKRSRSPDDADRRSRKPNRKDAGFKWKEKRRDGDEPERDQGLKRGYRDQYKPRQRSRSRSRSPPRRSEDRYGDRRERDRDQYRDRDSNARHASRVEHEDTRPPRRDDREKDDRRKDRPAEKEKKRPAAPPAAPAAQPIEMILVTVNDRLGTKKKVPCSPTDTIKDFKAIVAMMIGRRPHEILLKRQSERPFKDFLTLQDYGVSNNAQLDLEVDTGD